MKQRKPIVLTFVRCYLPGYKSGGPVRTIANVADQLGDSLDFRIVTSDRDSLDESSYLDIHINGWNRVRKANVYYASPDQRSVWDLAKVINSTPHDILYLNSFFNSTFTMKPLLLRRLGYLPSRPVIVAPRGEFCPGALGIKRWKKEPYLLGSQVCGLYRNVTWQASSEYEAADIRRVLGKTAEKIVIAQNLPSPIQAGICHKPAQREAGAPMRLIFISRISPKKNLDFALRVLAKVSIAVEMHIYGGIDDIAYWRRCQELIDRLPGHVTAIYHGSVHHDIVHETLSGFDLFFFPTLGENYGHVIFESLAAGVPVLVSDQTPWQDLDQESVGYVRPLDDENAFVEVIERHYRLDVNKCQEQSVKSFSYAQKIADNSNLVKQNLALFFDVLQETAKARG